MIGAGLTVCNMPQVSVMNTSCSDSATDGIKDGLSRTSVSHQNCSLPLPPTLAINYICVTKLYS